MIIVEVYVDDIIFGSNDEKQSKKIAAEMKNEFEMSMLGELTFFLRLQFSQFSKGIFISQNKYVKEILKKFNMEDCMLVCTPMIIDCKLSKEEEANEVDKKLYRSMIDNLLYVMTSRLDIMQSLGLVARFQATPEETH